MSATSHVSRSSRLTRLTRPAAAWLREAYFADLLAREERALRVVDRFVTLDGGQMRYCLAMEYAEHGDLGAWLGEHGAQSERFVQRLAAQGHMVTVIGEKPFWRLAAPRRTRKKARRSTTR